MRTIGLCLVVKNESKNIRPLLESIGNNVDAIYLTDTGSIDDTIEVAKDVAKEIGVPIEISHFKWVNDFGKARNFNFQQAKTDWIFWLDGDDIVIKSENIRGYIDFAEQRMITKISLPYQYFVENDKVKTQHPKDRFFRNGMYKWTEKARVHENAFILDGFEEKAWNVKDAELIIRHTATKQDLEESGIRNLKYLIEQEQIEGNRPDPRTVFLLGREYHAQHKLDEAKPYLEKYLTMVNYGHERVNVLSLLFSIAEENGEFDKCEDYAYEAIKSDSEHPMGYILVAKSYELRGLWKLALEWAKKSNGVDMSYTRGEVHTPQAMKLQQIVIMLECYKKLRKYKEGIKLLQEYQKDAEVTDIDGIRQDIAELRVLDAIKTEMKSFAIMANTALRSNRLEQLKSLLKILPESLLEEPEAVRLKRAVGLVKEWQHDTVTIFCGWNIEPWDEDSLETGVGGSETAVIYVSKELANRGYKVTVYNSVQEEKSFGNVTYLPVKQFNIADKFNIFISWRNPIIFEKDIYARKSYIWLHDVPNPRQFTDEIISKVDKVIVLSEYHRSLLPAVPNEKILISQNGIARKRIIDIPRFSHRICYTSSADRGLETLVDMLPAIRKEVPDAELHWAYGWDTFDKIRNDSASQAWKKALIEKMNKYGVVQHGRIGKKELAELYTSSHIWAYPTRFPEISCISCMEAQIYGAIPITSGFAALSETQLTGIKEMDNQKFIEAIIRTLQQPMESLHSIRNRSKIATERFLWSNMVDGLINEFGGKLSIIERDKIKVSVVCITTRYGVMRVLREQLEKQTHKNLELIIVDGKYSERAEEVKTYFGDFRYPVIHIPDPIRDRTKYPYGLFHADNAGLFAAKGELVVFLQDFIEIEPDGIEKFVNLYLLHPDRIYTGVDCRCHFTADKIDIKNIYDVFCFKPYKRGEIDYKSQRVRIGGAIRRSTEPMEWELNWAAAPLKILLELGGWNNEWDKGFGYDNTEIALRFVYNGGQIMVDETNMATALSHWDLFPDDKYGVENRRDRPNDETYLTYLSYLRDAKNPQTKLDFEIPKYPNYILNEIIKWKKDLPLSGISR